jgi:diguanylate cyclase (GGDEF)-like protein
MDHHGRQREKTRTVEFKAIRDSEAAPESRQAFLTVIRGSGTDLGRHLSLDRPIILGRAPECDLPLKDLGISWQHAQVLRREDGDYAVLDLGSTNGTRLNGDLVKGERRLREGDKIFLGLTVVRFSFGDEMDMKFQEEVLHLVGKDPLTGLESKRCFDDALDYALNISARVGRALAVLMMDLDGVKAINDTHGHLFGAHVIGEAGRLIDAVVKNTGHACRFGGDEFTAFLPGQDREQAQATAEAIRAAIEHAGITREGVPLPATISIGVASFPGDGREFIDLVAAADRALYRAKAAGKNCVKC